MAPILEARGLSRSFGHVRALTTRTSTSTPARSSRSSATTAPGKSTLVKALTGNLALDAGELFFEGKPVHDHQPRSRRPRWAWRSSTRTWPWRRTSTRCRTCSSAGRSPARASSAGSGFMDEKAMRAKAEAGLRASSAAPSGRCTAPVGAMSGGQRQQIAIVRAISWADKIVFLDEPTAALGVVQTKNVLDTIKRVRDKGIAVVLISHSMPHVLEVADRIQVMRLGTRVATLPAEGTTVEQLVGAMTGALDFSTTEEDAHERHHPARPTIAVVDHARAAASRCSSGWRNLQSVWILGVLLVIVVVLLASPPASKFLSTSNFSLISQNIAVWAVLGVGMTFVIITSGIDLSIGSVLVFSSVVAAKVMEAIGGDGWGVAVIGILAALVTGVAWGAAQRLPGRQGQDPAADRHPRHAVGRARPGPGDHRRHRHPRRCRRR